MLGDAFHRGVVVPRFLEGLVDTAARKKKKKDERGGGREKKMRIFRKTKSKQRGRVVVFYTRSGARNLPHR